MTSHLFLVHIILAHTFFKNFCRSAHRSPFPGRPVRTDGHRGLCGRLSSPNFCTKKMFMVKSTTRGKVGNLSKGVESFYVNQNCISTARPACGKPLWKNLWRLWKTMSYQQEFLLFPFCPLLVEKSAYIHVYSLSRRNRGRVTSPSAGSRYRKNTGKKLSSCQKTLSKAVGAFSQL